MGKYGVVRRSRKTCGLPFTNYLLSTSNRCKENTEFWKGVNRCLSKRVLTVRKKSVLDSEVLYYEKIFHFILTSCLVFEHDWDYTFTYLLTQRSTITSWSRFPYGVDWLRSLTPSSRGYSPNGHPRQTSLRSNGEKLQVPV